MLSSFVDFLRAEAALRLKSDKDPRAFLESGVRESISKVVVFENEYPQDLSEPIFDPIAGEDRTTCPGFKESVPTVGKRSERRSRHVFRKLSRFNPGIDQ
jgi:hypothetical protein